MSIQFPDAPAQGESFVATNGVSYTYDNGGWIANSQSALDDRYVNLNGDTMTGDLTVPSLNGGPLAGFRNQLINGSLAVNQRGATTYSADLTFSADRWKVGVNTTIDLGTIGVPEAGTGVHLFVQGTNPWTAQAIEINNAGGPFVVGQTYTVSYWIGQDTPLSPGAAAGWSTNGNGVGLVSFPMTTPVLIESSATTNWRRFSQSFTVDSVPFSGAKCVILTIQNTVSFAISAIQLEPGSVATPFELRPYATEFTLCQRYYVAGEAYVRAAPQGSTRNGCSIFFPTFMRTAPTTGASTKSGFGNTLAIDYVTNTGMVGSGNPNAVGELFFSYNADAEL